MLAVFFGLACFPIALLAYYKTKYILNPITAMFTLWGLILPFSCWGFYDTVIPSDKVYIIIALGLTAFLIGTMVGMRPVEYKLRNIINTSRKREYKFNYWLFYILGTITILYYISQLIIVIGLLRSGYDYTYIRNLSVSTETNELRSSALVTMTKAFIAAPMTYLTLAILPIELLKKKKNIIVIIESIVLMLCYLLSTGGRSVLLWCALYFIAVFLMRKKLSNYKEIEKLIKRYRRIIILGGITLFAVLIKMTAARKGDDFDLLNQMYIYFVCPLQNFDHHLKVVDTSSQYGYGLSSSYGLLYPFMFALSKLGINVFSDHVLTIYNMSFQNLQRGVNIGGGIFMNAFVTAFYQPYLDGRYVGVVIVMILFGFASGRSFYKAYYKNDTKSLLIYLLLLQKIIFSYVRFYFTQQAQSICFWLALFIIIQWKPSDDENKVIRF